MVTPGSSGRAAGISWPRDAASFATSRLALAQLCSHRPQPQRGDGEVSRSIVLLACPWGGRSRGFRLPLECPCCWVFKHRCLLLLTLSDKWRHFFHWKESQEFPCSLSILFFFPFCIVVKSLLLGRGWGRLAQGRGEWHLLINQIPLHSILTSIATLAPSLKFLFKLTIPPFLHPQLPLIAGP